METGQSFNPYSYTDAPPAVGDEPFQRPDKIPAGVIVLGILLLLMGGWGLLSSLFGVLTLVIQALTAGSSFGPSGPEMELQREFQSQMDGVAARLLPFTAINVAGTFLLSVPLVVAAIALFFRKEWARVLAIRTILACMIFTGLEIVLAVVGMYLQQSIMVNYFESSAAGSPLGSQASTFVYIGMGFGIAMLVVMYGIEYGIYAFGYWYLRKPDVKASFT
jgi:hypothetical protein